MADGSALAELLCADGDPWVCAHRLTRLVYWFSIACRDLYALDGQPDPVSELAHFHQSEITLAACRQVDSLLGGETAPAYPCNALVKVLLDRAASGGLVGRLEWAARRAGGMVTGNSHN